MSPPRLRGYYDAPLHFDCLATWKDREEFSRGRFVSALYSHWSGYGTLLRATPGWFLACGPPTPDKFPYFAAVQLADWSFSLYSRWREWDTYVGGDFRSRLDGPALDAAEATMAEVRREAPSREALEALFAERSAHPVARQSLVEFGDYLATLWGEAAYRMDWRALEQERQAAERDRAAQALVSEEQQRVRAQAIALSNEIARRLAAKLASGARLTCPRCHQRTHQMRFYEQPPDTRSYFVCKLCGRSFSGAEASEDP
ncbi:hypothetical protein [Hyalangium gracile]|uniref:hypothetical protein n=1 Tax=Hyalangium gracile TaxID=394092 RepID=UPI001CCEE4A3|nr:hypothetical protein [Hyalangium gracile]